MNRFCLEIAASSLPTPFITHQLRMNPAQHSIPRTCFGTSTSDSLAGAQQSLSNASEGEQSRPFLVQHEASQSDNYSADDNQSSHRQPLYSQRNFACSDREQVPQNTLKNTSKKKGTGQLEIFPGRNLSHLDSKPVLKMPIERDGLKPTSQQAKGRGQIKRVSAVVTQTDVCSDIEMATKGASLGCDAGAKSVSVAESCRVQNQSRGNRKEKRFLCDECGRDFVQKYRLEAHQRIHTGEKPFECPECRKRFTQQSGLMRHLLVHTGEWPFACGICGRAFTRTSSLHDHVRTHTGEKPFACEFCGKTFSLRSSLADHHLIHTGEKPHVCHVCNKAFRTKTHLRVHLRIHKPKHPCYWKWSGRDFAKKSQSNGREGMLLKLDVAETCS